MTHALKLFVFAIAMLPGVLAAQTVTRGPYLQQGTPDATTIVWRTDVATDGVVRYGTTAANLAQSSAVSANAGQHEVALTGLAPATRYYYAVGTPGAVLAGGTAEHYFVTAPTVGSRVPVRLWVVGDSGTGGSAQAAVRDAMIAHVGAARPDLYLHVGDMAYSDGLDDEFQTKFFDVYQPILRNTVVWPAMGNHEGHTSVSSTQTGPYYDAYVLPTNGAAGGLASGTEAYYSYDWGNVHFIVLDSHDTPRDSTGTMATWLTQDLAATNQDWIIAYWHHPPYTKGSHDSDSEGRLVDMREEILPILEAAGVDLVLGGHSHIYERSYLVNQAYDTPTTAPGHILDPGDGKVGGDGAYTKILGGSEGAVYVVAGHGGTGNSGAGNHPLMYFSELVNGSCVVDVDGDRLTLRNVTRDGVVSDEVTVLHGEGVFLLQPAGGERLVSGDTTEVRWLATNTRAVRLEFSADDGATWTVLQNEIVGAQSYMWAVPFEPTMYGRIRVTDADDATRTAMNGAPFVITDQAPQITIPYGGDWRYDDDGTTITDDSWTLPNFVDAAWPTGKAQLGYGDGDEATVLLDADPNIPAVLFRHTITLDRLVDQATIDALYDDAIGVFVNGELVHMVNLDSTDPTTYAGSSSSDNSMTRAELGPVNPFVVGENTIAVIVKQADGGSSDLSFDFQLTLTLVANFPDIPDMGMGNPDVGMGSDGGDTPDANTGGPDASVGGGPDVAVNGPDSATGDSGAGGPGQQPPLSGEPGGCSCGTAGGASPGHGLLIALLLVVGRRRRGGAK